MEHLYVIAGFDEKGKFSHYVRKGRNWSISGYDSLQSAVRGLAQTRSRYKNSGLSYKIVKFGSMEIV